MDTTREKTRRKLYRAIESHLECLMERGLLLPRPPRKAKEHDEVYAIVQSKFLTGRR
jgi:predicted RNase H-like HicB family nuclease